MMMWKELEQKHDFLTIFLGFFCGEVFFFKGFHLPGDISSDFHDS